MSGSSRGYDPTAHHQETQRDLCRQGRPAQRVCPSDCGQWVGGDFPEAASGNGIEGVAADAVDAVGDLLHHLRLVAVLVVPASDLGRVGEVATYTDVAARCSGVLMPRPSTSTGVMLARRPASVSFSWCRWRLVQIPPGITA